MAGDPLDANLLQMRKYYSASNETPDWENRKEVRRRRDMRNRECDSPAWKIGFALVLLVVFRPQGLYGNKKELTFVK